MSVKIAILAVAAASALLAAFGPSALPASAAPAKFVRCMATPLTVTEIGHGILGVDKRLTAKAINDWQLTTSQQDGGYYGNWSNALGGTVDCHRELFTVTCHATATPCRS